MRRFPRSRLPVLSALVVALLGSVLGPGSARGADEPAVNEVYPVPSSGTYTLQGRGFGHGHGLSQWGAYGAAKAAGLSSNQILHFYYPRTTLATKRVTKEIRVLLTAAGSPGTGYLEFEPGPGMTVTPETGKPVVLAEQPNAETIDRWRLQKAGAEIGLRAHSGDGWSVVAPDLGGSALVSDSDALIAVVQPSGSGTKTIRYRGQLIAGLQAGKLQTVNQVLVESYLRSVVPAEMPRSWKAAALQAQAVAARTYAWRAIASPKAPWYDIVGDTRDQAYAGFGAEARKTDKAIRATAGEIIVDSDGDAIFAQYCSANGGWTVSGGQPYLPSKRDPYDGRLPNGSHSWSTKLAAAAVAATYPSIGTLEQIVITGRDGHGAWGGRVTELSLVGSDGSKSLTGSAFQSAFGLRTTWFRPMPPPGAPRDVTATASAHTVTVTWKEPAAIAGAAAVKGYRVTLSPGHHVTSTDSSTSTATFTDIKAGTYQASVAAKSAVGRGPAASDEVTVKPLG